MSFEEDFPSLNDGKTHYTDLIYDFKDQGRAVDVLKVQEHCLDKQRVREAIEKRRDHFIDWRNSGKCGNDKLENMKIHTAIRILNELLEGFGL